MRRKADKSKRTIISGSTIAATGLIAAICFCVLFVIFRAVGVGAYTESEDAKNGMQYIAEIEKKDTKEIAERIAMTSKNSSDASAADKLAALGDEETDIWSLFDGIVIVGDSRAEAFVGYDYLPESNVEAKKGANLRYADEIIADVVARQPKCIIFTYGINDVTGNWKDAESFINRYKEIIEEYKKQLPNTDIFVCSIIPVYEAAVEEEPTLLALPEYAAAVKQMCEDEGYVFMDCDEIYEYGDLYEGDSIHFKSDMYPVWGRMMLEKVFEYESQQSAENND